MGANLFGKLYLVSIVCSIGLARPGKLGQQKYEFQQAHQTFEISQTQVEHGHASEAASMRVAPVQFEGMPWSQEHPNEVNAFAEMFRQHYNDKVKLHNEMMRHQHQMHTENIFEPVPQEFFNFHNEAIRNDFFGSQQLFVEDLADQLSHQLIHYLHQGLITQRDIHDPNFFVTQSAGELERVQISSAHKFFGSSELDESQQVQQQPRFLSEDFSSNEQQQQHQEHIFRGSDVVDSNSNRRETTLVLNPFTGFYDETEIDVNKESTEMTASSNVHQSYAPETSPNIRATINIDREVEGIEVHKPAWIEYPKEIRREPLATSTEKYYASTYDQQPIYDKEYLEQVTEKESKKSNNNIMSLVRKKVNNVDQTNSNNASTTTTTTTTLKPTTESNVMSMLPHKKSQINVAELQEKLKKEMEKHLEQEQQTTSTGETHFLGMSSNKEQEKLAYETIDKTNSAGETRGDQPSVGDDYAYEDSTELQSAVLSTTTTTTTTNKPNPYYSAPLAPFPEHFYVPPQDVPLVQITPNNQHLEIEETDLQQRAVFTDYHEFAQAIETQSSNHQYAEDIGQHLSVGNGDFGAIWQHQNEQHFQQHEFHQYQEHTSLNLDASQSQMMIPVQVIQVTTPDKPKHWWSNWWSNRYTG